MTTTPSDETQPANDDAESPDSSRPEYPPITPVVPMHQQPDQSLVEVAAVAHVFGFPLTLYMPWGIATGQTCGYAEYYKHLGEVVRAGSATAPEEWQEAADRFAKNTFDHWAEESPDDRDARRFVQGFDLMSGLVLRQANCLLAGAQQPIRHDYLRVRLTDVTAWSWGCLTWDES